MDRQLLLASSSSYRKELLTRLGLPFATAHPNTDETPLPNESPQALAERLARAKAHALAADFPNALIIGSDQTADCLGKLLGKPGTPEKAEHQLQYCRGNTVTFFTGLCLLDSHSGAEQVCSVPFLVKFLPLSDEQIKAYIKKEQPLDCAGSFKCEGLGSALFEQLSGDDPTALVGLPLIQLCRMLRNAGVDPLAS